MTVVSLKYRAEPNGATSKTEQTLYGSDAGTNTDFKEQE
jgi:hypothetical protein